MLIFFNLPATAHTSNDTCALITADELSKVFGESFAAADRLANPADSLQDPSLSCIYKGKTITVMISSFEYSSVVEGLHYWQIRRAHNLAKSHAVDVPGVGDSAFYRRYSLQSHQGIYDYNFSVRLSASNANADWKDGLVRIAKLFYSRLK